MKHALIVGGDRRSTDCLEDGLWNAGFHSIFRARDGHEVTALLRDVHPSLIVIAPGYAVADRLADLCRLSDEADAPIIVATAGAREVLDCLGADEPDLVDAVEADMIQYVPQAHELLQAA
jgi:AmiR/NasT family two-component response regulator